MTLTEIKKCILDIKDGYDADVEAELDESIKSFNSGNFYEFLTILQNVLLSRGYYASKLSKDFDIIQHLFEFSKEIIDNGFFINFAGDVIPFQKMVDEGYVYVEGNTLVGYNKEYQDFLNETMYLPRHITKIGKEALKDSIYIKNVYLHNGFRELEEGAFNSSDVEKIFCYADIKNIPDNLCSECVCLESVHFIKPIEKIGDRAFFKCRSLEELDVKGDYSVAENSFEECFSLDISKLNS